ncbi:DUF1800 domain-containing protein [Thiomonas sp. FB-Cd]|uniref:DUF1800 domain-containing protein n=1 Tax=Thiomonas sp. FB-Cd TaxID=1158292 RepID=UPI0006910CFA|nr:DUF1800 domain-containing protein [Thiomonas sp. FB-Cd]
MRKSSIHPQRTGRLAGSLWALAASGALVLAGCAAQAAPLGSAPGVTSAQHDAAVLNTAARLHPVAFLDRIGWGASAAQLQELSRVGATRFLDAQLRPDPGPVLPAEVRQQIAALQCTQPLNQLIPPLVRQMQAIQQARHEGQAINAQQAQAALQALNQRKNQLTQEAMTQQLLLAVYAPNQLQQRLTWFWLNHFNVFRGGNIGPMMADYTQHVIAPRALGPFRDLLQATMFSPQMLLYLNNAQNARGHVNENYAREVMELHTLGVGGGYTQTDVTNLARALTGLGVDLGERPVHVRPALRNELWQHGLVVFNPARHDPDPKVVLGHVLQGRGLEEIEQVITLLADDPATARHVSMELAQYFVGDRPDPAMVNAMVQTWARTRGNMAAVMRTMLTSPQFAASLSAPQFKDPMRYVVSAARASFSGRIITNTQPLIGMLYRLGEPLYGRQTPDGFALSGATWDSPGQLTTRFEVAQQIGAGAPALFGPPPPFLRTRSVADPANAAGTIGEPGSAMAGAGAMLTQGAAQRSVPPKLPRRPPPDLARSTVFLAAEPDLGRSTLEALAQTNQRMRWNALWLSSPEFMND